MILYSAINILYLLDLQDDFSSLDFSITGPKAFFSNMPLSKTLTMNLDVPEPWLIEPVIAVYVAFMFFLLLSYDTVAHKPISCHFSV